MIHDPRPRDVPYSVVSRDEAYRLYGTSPRPPSLCGSCSFSHSPTFYRYPRPFLVPLSLTSPTSPQRSPPFWTSHSPCPFLWDPSPSSQCFRDSPTFQTRPRSLCPPVPPPRVWSCVLMGTSCTSLGTSRNIFQESLPVQ